MKIIKEKVEIREPHSANEWTEGLLHPSVSKVSNCCGVKMYGVDKDGVGVCTECHEMAEETDEYEVSNG